MKFEKAITILYSTDISRSIKYYTEILGFEQHWEWDNPPTFGGISRNDVEIFFCRDGQGHPGTWLSIMLDDVDAYYENIKAKGAKIAAAPQSMEWNTREMLVEDPDGHMIRFGHRIDCD